VGGVGGVGGEWVDKLPPFVVIFSPVFEL